MPTVEQLSAALTDVVLPQLRAVARAVYTGGRFTGVDGGAATFALPNGPMQERAGKARAEVEAALAGYFGHAVPVTLVVDGATTSPGPAVASGPTAAPAPAPVSEESGDGDECVDLSELTDATDVAAGGADKLTQAFPGAVVVEEDQ